MTTVREPKKRKEEREIIYVGINGNDIEKKFNLRVPHICNCHDAQYIMKAQISEEYSARGVLAKHFYIRCLKCGKVENFKPEGEESLIEDNRNLF